MPTDKPSRNEDEYFAREEHERLARLRAKEAAERVAAERKSHHLKCPKCGAGLVSEKFHGVQVDRCPEDGGIWLDAGEIDLLLKEEDHSILRRVFRDVAGSLRKGK
ncbi:MAG TPA: zf-TFIIB domain-containing protein [Gemmatimonadales bacterium]|nr:zf-TFIIB domain-containing protein [Gemmatimonadales bacterium]